MKENFNHCFKLSMQNVFEFILGIIERECQFNIVNLPILKKMQHEVFKML